MHSGQRVDCLVWRVVVVLMRPQLSPLPKGRGTFIAGVGLQAGMSVLVLLAILGQVEPFFAVIALEVFAGVVPVVVAV